MNCGTRLRYERPRPQHDNQWFYKLLFINHGSKENKQKYKEYECDDKHRPTMAIVHLKKPLNVIVTIFKRETKRKIRALISLAKLECMLLSRDLWILFLRIQSHQTVDLIAKEMKVAPQVRRNTWLPETHLTTVKIPDHWSPYTYLTTVHGREATSISRLDPVSRFSPLIVTRVPPFLSP